MKLNPAPQLNATVLTLAPNEQFNYTARPNLNEPAAYRITSITIKHDVQMFFLITSQGQDVAYGTTEQTHLIPNPSVRATVTRVLHENQPWRVLDFNQALQRAITQGRRHR